MSQESSGASSSVSAPNTKGPLISSKKRKSENMVVTAFKVPKKDLAPIFTTSKSTLRWLTGENSMFLHGIHRDPAPQPKVALFDLDGTLIRPQGGRKYPKAASDWEWWHGTVKKRLEEAHKGGFSIVIVSNQGGFSYKGSSKGPSKRDDWKKKLSLMASQLSGVPFRVFAAGEYDQYRKPRPGMWNEILAIHAERGVTINKNASYMVGDAAGRLSDHSCADRQFALNAGVRFLTPEEYFLGHSTEPYTLTGFHPSLLPAALPLYTPYDTPLVPLTSVKPEIVLFVGYPSAGKSTIYRTYFEPEGYIHINQDKLRTIKNCLERATITIESGLSCVVDNTNRDKTTRANYTALPEIQRASCINFEVSFELANHNNVYRAYFIPAVDGEKRRKLLDMSAFTSFKAAYEVPSLSEGFTEIKTLNWVFDGTGEDYAAWNMWLN